MTDECLLKTPLASPVRTATQVELCAFSKIPYCIKHHTSTEYNGSAAHCMCTAVSAVAATSQCPSLESTALALPTEYSVAAFKRLVGPSARRTSFFSLHPPLVLHW